MALKALCEIGSATSPATFRDTTADTDNRYRQGGNRNAGGAVRRHRICWDQNTVKTGGQGVEWTSTHAPRANPRAFCGG